VEPFSPGSSRSIEDAFLGLRTALRAVAEEGREGEDRRRNGVSVPGGSHRDGTALRLGRGGRAALETDSPRRRAARTLDRGRSRVPAGAVMRGAISSTRPWIEVERAPAVGMPQRDTPSDALLCGQTRASHG